jgi:uncharacterized protein (TIGR02246 family)
MNRLLLAANTGNVHSVKPDEAAHALFNQWADGFASKNAESVLSAFTDQADLFVIIGTTILRGKDSVAEYLRSYALGPVLYEWRWDSVHPVAVGDVGLVYAEGTETRSTPAGARDISYRVTLVARFEDGEWRIAHFHGSSPRPVEA